MDNPLYLGGNQSPHDIACKNPGLEDHFTCPGCYGDLGGRVGDIVQCDACDAVARLSIEQEPVAVASLIPVADAEDFRDELDALDFIVENDPEAANA
jgi:hypothetical protein